MFSSASMSANRFVFISMFRSAVSSAVGSAIFMGFKGIQYHLCLGLDSGIHL